MFVLKQSDTYRWPVNVSIPIDNGRYEQQSFVAEFKRLPQSRIDEILAALRAEHAEDPMTEAELADELLVGWDRVRDADGEPLPFSETAKAALLDVLGARAALTSAWFESLTGAKRKN